MTLKNEYSGPRYESIKNIKFEIQVRTIAMDAWANISHYLSYKPASELTNDIKKDLYSTSAMFYLADRNFERIYSEHYRELRSLTKLFVTATIDDFVNVEITSLTMSAFLKAKFSSRIAANSAAINCLVRDLSMAGYKTLDKIYKRIIDMKQIMEICEIETSKGIKTGDVGLVNEVMLITDPKFCRIFYPDPAQRKYANKHYKKYRLLWKKVLEKIIGRR